MKHIMSCWYNTAFLVSNRAANGSPSPFEWRYLLRCRDC
jgi:hypothetical protein